MGTAHRMTLADISDLSQALGALAVVASLVFVSFQIRQNTAATRAASHHAVSDALNQINFLFAEHAEVTRIFLSGLADRQALAVDEQWRFDAMCRAYLHVCETMFVQATLGAGDRSIVLAEENGIKTLFASPGMRDWWAQNPYGFSGEFRAHVDRLCGATAAAGTVE